MQSDDILGCSFEPSSIFSSTFPWLSVLTVEPLRSEISDLEHLLLHSFEWSDSILHRVLCSCHCVNKLNNVTMTHGPWVAHCYSKVQTSCKAKHTFRLQLYQAKFWHQHPGRPMHCFTCLRPIQECIMVHVFWSFTTARPLHISAMQVPYKSTNLRNQAKSYDTLSNLVMSKKNKEEETQTALSSHTGPTNSFKRKQPVVNLVLTKLHFW